MGTKLGRVQGKLKILAGAHMLRDLHVMQMEVLNFG